NYIWVCFVMNKSFNRHIWNELISWKEASNSKPLILRGARQVGKTTLVRSLGEIYDYFIELNLEKEEDISLIERSNNVHELVDIVALRNELTTKSLTKTLLFIDEIQESEKAISFLRYFYEDVPELNVIAAGSLLEHTLGKTKHFPVGRVNYLYLFPFNFQEYLEAMGKERLLERLHNIPIDEVAHEILMKEFHTYCIIGGMPEIVVSYAT